MNRPLRPAYVFLFFLVMATLALPETAAAYNSYTHGLQRELAGFIRGIVEFLKNPPLPIKIAFCVTGGLCLIYGYAIYRYIVMTPGFLFGGMVGWGIGYMEWGHWVGIVLGIFCAFIGAGLAWALHQFIIWIIGALVGGALAVGISLGIFQTEPNILVVIIAAFLGGSLLLALAKSLIILKTSVLGAFMVMVGSGKIDSLSLFFLLFFLGVAIQFGVAKLLPGRGVKSEATTSQDQPAIPQSPSLKKMPEGDLLHGMLVTLEKNKEKITEMIQRECSLIDIQNYFSTNHQIPEHITYAYLEELSAG